MQPHDEPLECQTDWDETAPEQAFAPVVLLAEDDDELRSLLSSALRTRGYTVYEARNGREVLEELSRGVLAPAPLPCPDLLVTDLRMPGFGGLEILGLLRAARSSLPSVLITAFGDAETHARAFEAGASAVIDKPFTLRDLLQTVRILLNRSE